MSRPDFDPRGNKDVGDISEPEYGSSLTRVIEWIYELVRWLRQREPVTPGDPFTKFATMGRLVQLGVVTEKAVLGDDDDQNPDEDAVEPQYVVVHAREMYPSATAGATGPTSDEISSAKPNIQYIEFSALSDSSAEFQLIMPFGWPGNAFQFRVYWSHPTGASNYGVSWKLQAHSATDQEAIGSDFADGGQVDDDGGTADDLYITAESSPITISGINAKAGDLIFGRITRMRTTSPNDTLNVVARLHAIRFNLGESPVEFPPEAVPVALLLPFDGNFTDSSTTANVFTTFNSAVTSATRSRFGGQSFVSNGSYYVTCPDNAAFAFGTRLWSIDFWIYIPTAASLAADNCIVASWNASADYAWFVGLSNTGILRFYFSPDGSAGAATYWNATASALPRDQWVHIAIWRSFTNNNIASSVNGAAPFSVTAPGAFSLHDPAGALSIGAVPGGAVPLPSGIAVDELRIVVDTIDYDSSSFTPPTSAYA